MDPLHEIAASHSAWTTGNTAEALPGVCTALSWTFFGPACEAGMRLGFRRMGALRADELPVPDAVDERFSAVALGRFAGNIDLMARMGERLPGTQPEKIETQLFGEVRDVERHPTRARYPVVAVRMPAELATSLRRLRALRAETGDWWEQTIRAMAGPGQVDPAAARAVLRSAGERFAQNMALHTIVTMVGSGMFEQLEALCEAAGGPHTASQLATGHGDSEETRIAADLWAVSRDRLTMAGFLRRHGWQGADAGQLHQRVWREQPPPVERLVQTYAGMDDTASPLALERRQEERRRDAEAALLADLRGLHRVRGRALLAIAGRWIAHREVGKAGYLLCVDGARAAARALGRRLAADGALEDPDDVVHLTVPELLDPPRGDLRGVVAERRARRDELLALQLPGAWIGDPVPVVAEPEAPEADGDAPIAGVGVNPGVVEGRVNVVLDPFDADLEAGEILVCTTTDPSWVSLFVPAAGVIIDIGGHMSHGAIVAREMGIPCVINTRDGSRRLRTGDLVRMDGATGEVVVLETAPGAPSLDGRPA